MKIYLPVFLAILLACSTPSKEEQKTTEEPKIEVEIPEFRVKKKYSENRLLTLDSAELRIMRNQIFAQYGYIFQSPELKDHFNQKDWYNPTRNSVDTLLTELDKENIALVRKYEDLLKTKKLALMADCEQITKMFSEYEFISNIELAIDSLGSPFETHASYEGTCPHGQMHIWNNRTGGYRVGILGDEYSKEPNYKAKSRVYVIQNLKLSMNTNISFNGIYLGEPYSSLEQKINCLTTDSTFTSERYEGSSVIDNYFTGTQQFQIILNGNGLVIHFSINTDNELDFILVGTFEPRYAC